MVFEQVFTPLGPFKGQTKRTDIPLQMPILYVTCEAFLRVEIGITGGALELGRWVTYLIALVLCFRGCPADIALFVDFDYRWGGMKVRILSNRLGGSGVRDRAIIVVTGPPKILARLYGGPWHEGGRSAAIRMLAPRSNHSRGGDVYAVSEVMVSALLQGWVGEKRVTACERCMQFVSWIYE
jgi:hypothetical protein